MTEFEKNMVRSMTSWDRVRLYILKANELTEVAELLTDEDKQNVIRVLDCVKDEERSSEDLDEHSCDGNALGGTAGSSGRTGR